LHFAGACQFARSAAECLSIGAKLSAADIVDKNVAARGGLQAWRAVQTMSLSGKLGAGGNQRATLQVPVSGKKRSASETAIASARPAEEVQLPFVMEVKRPAKCGLSCSSTGATAIQVYDGANGWKLKTFSIGMLWSHIRRRTEDVVHAGGP